MNEQVKILDHGYVQLIESWGSDERIIESARMSTGNKGFVGWAPGACPRCIEGAELNPNCEVCAGTGEHKGDESLLRYLYTNKHATPFEFGGMTVEIQAPIFVFREWHRHRTQSYAEMSARYTPLPDFNYMPTVDRCIVVPGGNKQARGTSTKVPTHEEVLRWLVRLGAVYETAQDVYQQGLDLGIPKEVARCPVPVARYSRMRASTDLRNWLGFLTLRMAPTAQWEIRQFANAVGELIKEKFPRTWVLFDQKDRAY